MNKLLVRRQRPICSPQILLGAAGREALSAQHGSPGRRLEGHRVGFAALVAGDLEPLALAARAASPAPAKVGATRVAASLATLRLAEVPLRVILLLTFCEWECRAALGTSDLYVWHLFLPAENRARVGGFPLSLKGLALVFVTAAKLTVIERGRTDSFCSQGLRGRHPAPQSLFKQFGVYRTPCRTVQD
jgi:hypothetical protein